MNICYIMEPWESLDVEFDTTLRLVHESALRKHTVAITSPSNLTIRNSDAFGFCRLLSKQDKVSPSVNQFYKKTIFKDQLLPLSGFDAIFMRADPPIDNIMLNILETVRHDTFIINDVQGLQKANNKIYASSFYDPKNKIIPTTHVSKNKTYLRRIINESENEKMILKPLTGFGGQGVIVIEKNAPQNIDSLLDFYIGSSGGNYVIVQECIEGAEEGDVRILMLNGEPIGAMKRVPSKGDIRSNVHAGGSVEKHVLSKQEKQLCKLIGPQLVADGLYFVGIDVIKGKLLEVNVCSPGGITRINKLNRVRLQEMVIDFIEEIIRKKEAAFTRKQAFKKTVEDA